MKTNVAKRRYRLFRRGNGNYYSECALSRKQKSLGTKDETVAKSLIDEMNDAARSPVVSRAKAIVSLAVCDPLFATRTWMDVKDKLCSEGKRDMPRSCG